MSHLKIVMKEKKARSVPKKREESYLIKSEYAD